MNEKVAPLQEELAVMKVEVQQLKERLEQHLYSSKLVDFVYRLQKATVQQATQTGQAARQLRPKNEDLKQGYTCTPQAASA